MSVQPDNRLPVLELCRRLEAEGGTRLSLSELAEPLGMSASTLHRQFSQQLGISPKAYQRALQLHRWARSNGRDRLDEAYAAGFESASRAWETIREYLGEPPGRLRANEQLDYWLGLSELGWMLMAASQKGICWLGFGDQPDTLIASLRGDFPRAHLIDNRDRLLGWFDSAREQLLLPSQARALPLDVRGTAFQARVWTALRRIPLGETRSYRDLAQELNRASAVRAVAGACACNRIALLIPCHRVIGKNGKPTGYRWGIERKRHLLRSELG